MINSRILTSLIVLLLIIIFGEFFYLFILKRDNSPTSLTTLITPTIAITQDAAKMFPPPQPNQALDENSLTNLRILKKGVVTSSTLQYTMEGTIDKIEYLTNGDRKGIKFTIKASNGNINNFIYPNLPYVTVKNSNNEEVDIFSVKKNDLVTINVDYDIMKSEFKKIIINIR